MPDWILGDTDFATLERRAFLRTLADEFRVPPARGSLLADVLNQGLPLGSITSLTGRGPSQPEIQRLPPPEGLQRGELNIQYGRGHGKSLSMQYFSDFAMYGNAALLRPGKTTEGPITFQILKTRVKPVYCPTYWEHLEDE